MDTIMERDQPMQSLAILVTMDIDMGMDIPMFTMATMDITMVKDQLMLSLDMDMDMVMDTTVNKQHLFISFQNSVTSIGTCWNLVNRNTHLEKKYKKSFYEIKKNKINCVNFY